MSCVTLIFEVWTRVNVTVYCLNEDNSCSKLYKIHQFIRWMSYKQVSVIQTGQCHSNRGMSSKQRNVIQTGKCHPNRSMPFKQRNVIQTDMCHLIDQGHTNRLMPFYRSRSYKQVNVIHTKNIIQAGQWILEPIKGAWCSKTYFLLKLIDSPGTRLTNSTMLCMAGVVRLA